LNIQPVVGERHEVYAGKVITLVERVAKDSGVYNVVEHPGAAAAVPVTPEGQIVLIRQYRRAIQEWIWEIPAGTREPGESPEDTMTREVIEEIGWEADRLDSLGAIVTAPGFSDQRIHLFVAHLRREVGTAHEADEVIEVHIKEWPEVKQMLASHEIRDGKSLAALYRYAATLA